MRTDTPLKTCGYGFDHEMSASPHQHIPWLQHDPGSVCQPLITTFLPVLPQRALLPQIPTRSVLHCGHPQDHYTLWQQQAQACTPASPPHSVVMGFGLRPTPYLLAVMTFGLRPTPYHPVVMGFLIASACRWLGQWFAHHNARRIARRIAHCFCLLTAISSVCGLQYLLTAIATVCALQCSSNRASDHSSLPLIDSYPNGLRAAILME